MERAAIIAMTGVLVFASAAPADGQTLRGSTHAMQQQNRVARDHDFTFLHSASQVRSFVDAGYLVRVPGNADYELASVSYPYARPAVKLFIERLASQYRSACGEKLVVTSLTRPTSEQPNNASALSVHPAGMAVDLRVSGRAACRNWIERTLLSLEKQGVLNAIRENRPPHYHVALFPNQYTQYVARMTGQSPARLAAAIGATPAGPASAGTRASAPAAAPSSGSRPAATPVAARTVAAEGPSATSIATALASQPEALERHTVSRGETLWSIARQHGTTVEVLKAVNRLRSSTIVAGQTLQVPAVASVDINP
jgi:LysM repeat protein